MSSGRGTDTDRLHARYIDYSARECVEAYTKSNATYYQPNDAFPIEIIKSSTKKYENESNATEIIINEGIDTKYTYV